MTGLEALAGEHEGGGADRQHHPGGQPHALILRARGADQTVDDHREGGSLRAGQERRRPELPQAGGQGEPGGQPPGAQQVRPVHAGQHPARAGAERGRDLPLARVDRPHAGQQGAHHQWHGDHGLCQRQNPPAAGQPGRGQGDQEAEAHRHRGHPQRQHEHGVEQRDAASQQPRAWVAGQHQAHGHPHRQGDHRGGHGHPQGVAGRLPDRYQQGVVAAGGGQVGVVGERPVPGPAQRADHQHRHGHHQETTDG